MNEYGDYLENLLGDNKQTKILASTELSLFEKIKELDKIGYRVVKKLTIPNVSQQRELLNAFVEFYNDRQLNSNNICYDEIDLFLDSI